MKWYIVAIPLLLTFSSGNSAPKEKAPQKAFCENAEIERNSSLAIRTEAKTYGDGFKAQTAKVSTLEAALMKLSKCDNRYGVNSAISWVECSKDEKTGQFTGDACRKFGGNFYSFVHTFNLSRLPDVTDNDFSKAIEDLFNSGIIVEATGTQGVRY